MTRKEGNVAKWLMGLLGELVKTWIGPFAIGISAFLLYPFQWLTAVSAVLMALGSILMAYAAKRFRRLKRSWKVCQIGSILAGCAILPWVAISPFLGTKPLYVCQSSKTDISGTFCEPIVANG